MNSEALNVPSFGVKTYKCSSESSNRIFFRCEISFYNLTVMRSHRLHVSTSRYPTGRLLPLIKWDLSLAGKTGSTSISTLWNENQPKKSFAPDNNNCSMKLSVSQLTALFVECDRSCSFSVYSFQCLFTFKSYKTRKNGRILTINLLTYFSLVEIVIYSL